MRANAAGPSISVIIPVFNGEHTLARCLNSLYASTFKDFEIIVIDDHSTDRTAVVLNEFQGRPILCSSILLTANGGPGAARNLGAARAKGRIFFFLDADILVEPDSLAEIAAAFAARPETGALFGSYHPDSVTTDFFSRFKNLLHHHTHQTSSEQATTFCGGFGAIRRDEFVGCGGFDASYRYLEDVEMGERLSRAGCRIWLNKHLQFSHCKRYTLAGLIRSDVYGRAIPWTRLILKTGKMRGDLNTQLHNIASVPVSFLLLLGIVPAMFSAWAALVWILLFVCLILLNRPFLGFVWKTRGARFACGATLMYWLFYLYSGSGVVIGIAGHLRDSARHTETATEKA